MANLKEVRDRIASVISTQQITKAMKMVSAAKFRRAQQGIVQMRPYADRLNSMLSNILVSVNGNISSPYSESRDVQSALLVVITSSRGLCGAFNTYIIKEAQQTLMTPAYANARSQGKLTVLCIGKKGYDAFKKYKDINIIDAHVGLMNQLNFDKTAGVVDEIMASYLAKQYDMVTVAYAQFKNAATQTPMAVQFLPVEFSDKAEHIMETKPKHQADYIFMPDTESLLQEIVPGILQTSFYKFLLDTNASEHGARMTAMDKATENANDMLRELRINYNKARQEAITKELSEIVGGAAALEG